MIKRKIFSIIVISLNTKKDFLKTIKSIMNQTFKDKEIIIIDGFSTDGTINKINELKKNFSKVIIEKDKGIYDAMNKGLRLSEGEWILFLNSGDILFNSSTLENIFKKIKFNSEIVFGNTIIYNEFYYKFYGNYFNDKTIKIPFNHQSVFVKKKLFENNLFTLKYKISSDFEFFIKHFKNNANFQKINMDISIVSSGGISDKKRFLVLLENFRILKDNKLLKNKIFFLFINFIYFLIVKILKIFIPQFLLKSILRIKYKKKIIEYNEQ